MKYLLYKWFYHIDGYFMNGFSCITPILPSDLKDCLQENKVRQI